MKINNVYLDSNIVFSVFITNEDYKMNEKNIKIYTDAIISNKNMKINKVIVAEIYHTLFKKMSKKYCKKNNIKVTNINTLLKNSDLIGYINTITTTIFQTMEKTDKIKFEIDYVHMFEAILKYKISAMDYLFYKDANGKILTGDEDFAKFVEDNN